MFESVICICMSIGGHMYRQCKKIFSLKTLKSQSKLNKEQFCEAKHTTATRSCSLLGFFSSRDNITKPASDTEKSALKRQKLK